MVRDQDDPHGDERTAGDGGDADDREEGPDGDDAIGARPNPSSADATSELDQIASELDQTASDRDQTASERDQATADHFQEVSSAESEEVAYEASRAERLEGALERERTTLERDRTGSERLEHAARRDESAQGRDQAAAARDRAAEERDRTAAELEAKLAPRDESAIAMRRYAAALRERAAADRERAAADRERAAADRANAIRDRAQLRSDLVQAHVDSLTGAFGRELGMAELQREIDRSRRSEGRLVLAFVDLDGLKEINDHEGHAAGDRFLKAAVATIRSHLRSYDPVVRVGGDEFVVAVSGVEPEIITRRFDAIRSQIERERPSASISVGITALRPDESLDDLLDRGDKALYEEKHSKGCAGGVPTPAPGRRTGSREAGGSGG